MRAAITIEGNLEPIDLEDQCVIGRKSTVDVPLNDARVSREHAIIRKQGDDYWLYDLNSANGTMINGAPVAKPTRLKDNDRMQIGGVLLHFHSENPNSATAPGVSDATIIGYAEKPMIFLVADIKGYTQLSSFLSDAEITDLMRDWYAQAQIALQRAGAVIDKFIGDCVFAYWMETDPESHEAALHCARALLGMTNEISERNRAKLTPHGLALACGIGLHSGLANIGAMVRGQKTALGDSVNLTFRIEGLTRSLNTPVVLTASFMAGWPAGRDFCESCGEHAIKGYDKPVEVFRPKEIVF